MPAPELKKNKFIRNPVIVSANKNIPDIYLSGSHITLLVQNNDLRYISAVNPKAFAGFDLVGKSDQQVFDPLEAERLKIIKDEVLATGKPLQSEISLTIRDKRLFFDGYFFSLVNDNGKIDGVISLLSDITRRKEIEYSLLAEKEERVAILENVSDPIWFKNRENRYLFVNSSFAKILGLNRDKIINNKDEDLPWSLEIKKIREEQFWKVVSQKKKETVTEKVIDSKGNNHWFESVLVPVFLDAQKLSGVISISREITERYIFEEQQVKVNRALKMTLSCGRASMKAISEEAAFNDICRLIIELGGYRMSFIGYYSAFEKMIKPIRWGGFEEGYTEKINQGDLGGNPYLKAASTGKPIFISNIGSEKTLDFWKEGAVSRGYRSLAVLPLKINGDVFAVLAVFSDFSAAFDESEKEYLTEISNDLSFGINLIREKEKNKVAIASLAESENKFKVLAESSPFSIFLYRDKFLYVNKAGELLSGYSLEETRNMFFWQIIHPEFRELIKNRGLSRLKGESVPSRYEFKILRKDGKEFWVDFTGSLIMYGGLPTGLGIAYDITEKKSAENIERERSFELEKLNNLMIGRELKMIELKKENEELRRKVNLR